MPLYPSGPDDDGWTAFVVGLFVVTDLTLAVTIYLGVTAFSGSPTTDPAVPVLFGLALVATVLLGKELLAVSPLPGVTHPIFADEAEGENWTVYVGGLAMAALMGFGLAAIIGSVQFVADPGSPDPLLLTLMGVSLANGTVLTARVLNLLYRSSASEVRSATGSGAEE